jgi:regulatory protein
MQAKVQLSLKGRALKWLSMREHSRSELRAKLLRVTRPRESNLDVGDELDQAERNAAVHSARVDALLDELEQLKYLSDERFVEALSLRRASRFGLLKLKHELSMHKIATPLVKAALEEARASELSRATEVWARKFNALPESMQERAKHQRFLASRGFSGGVVFQVLKGRVVDDD